MESRDVRGQVAVITGASAGIGAASARALAAVGMDLVLGARRAEPTAALAAELATAHGVRAAALPLDVTDAASSRAFHAGAVEFAGDAGFGLFLNNAGLGRGVARIPGATDEDESDWLEMIDTNVVGFLRVLRLFVGDFVQQDRGLIVSMGSVAALWPYEGGSVYCATKSSVRTITRSLRKELKGTRVRVSVIHPGLVETEFSQVRFRGDTEKAAAAYQDMTPLTGEDVASVVVWLAGLPAHMNIEEVSMMAVDQVSTTEVYRRPS